MRRRNTTQDIGDWCIPYGINDGSIGLGLLDHQRQPPTSFVRMTCPSSDIFEVNARAQCTLHLAAGSLKLASSSAEQSLRCLGWPSLSHASTFQAEHQDTMTIGAHFFLPTMFTTPDLFKSHGSVISDRSAHRIGEFRCH
jgi:hypothetical protein